MPQSHKAKTPLTIGSVSRSEAANSFPFLAGKVRKRRRLIRHWSHLSPDFVFWICPQGRLIDAGQSHLKNPPKSFEGILTLEPDYGGFFRGRIASNFGPQGIVVYCRPEHLSSDAKRISQFCIGMSQSPVPISTDCLVFSDNGDIFGTLEDVANRIDR